MPTFPELSIEKALKMQKICGLPQQLGRLGQFPVVGTNDDFSLKMADNFSIGGVTDGHGGTRKATDRVNFALKMMNFAFKKMDFVLKMMIFVLKLLQRLAVPVRVGDR